MYKISYKGNKDPDAKSTRINGQATATDDKIYSFTHEYETRYNDLRSWALKPGSKCLFQHRLPQPPAFNLNYCDLFGEASDDTSKERVSECCFLCEAEVTTLGAGMKNHDQHLKHTGLKDLDGLSGAGTDASTSSVLNRRYEAVLGAVYPNILLDM
jgi:hypothetical protein